MIIGGLITFGMRFSLIYLFGKLEIPETMRKALHYVPPAVLSAIIFPELLIRNGALDISLNDGVLDWTDEGLDLAEDLAREIALPEVESPIRTCPRPA